MCRMMLAMILFVMLNRAEKILRGNIISVNDQRKTEPSSIAAQCTKITTPLEHNEAKTKKCNF